MPLRRRVPKKNISSRIADIREPTEGMDSESPVAESSIKPDIAERVFTADAQEASDRDERSGACPTPRFSLGKILFAVFTTAVLASGAFLAHSYRSSVQSLTAASETIEQFRSAFDERGLLEASTTREDSGGGPPPDTWGFLDITSIIPLFKGTAETYRDVQNLSFEGIQLLKRTTQFGNEWLDLVLERKGEALLGSIEGIQKNLITLIDIGSKITEKNPALKNFLLVNPSGYLAMQAELNRTKTFVDAVVSWLQSPEEHRLLVFLYNTSEMRPAGGFLGSYAELAIRNANLEEIEIHDVSEADRELEAKIVPPKPLQLIVKRWRAADANWFFDFADSAEKTVQLLEASNKYRTVPILFDGAIAVTPKAVGDLLALTGPITIREGGLTIDRNNFLAEIQEEVQAGHAAGSGRPKQVLGELTPLLFEKLAGLGDDKKRAVSRLLFEWVEKRDLLAYFREPALQSFLEAYDGSGTVFPLPQDFVGDYLAVVNANIGGGKTDAVMKQVIVLQSQIGNDGVVSDRLTVLREHRGKRGDPSWYRVPNQSYVKVFTPPGALLQNSIGGIEKKIIAPVDYDREGYVRDPQLAAIESSAKTYFSYPAVQSFTEAGKNVFALWARTASGATSTLTLDYARRLPLPPTAGQTYQFIFEKQPGSRSAYHFEINAPVGFRFSENGLPVFEYETDDPPGRLILNLTLEKVLE